MRIKILDKLLIKNFIGPFIVTFFIGIFVLIMQTLWLYMDDIAGKGAGIFLIIEFLAYLSVSLIPMALPIAVLISSVMVLGGLAEHYELSSFKSAGVTLARVMRPLMFVGLLISIASFFCSNNLMPVSNLKFKSRLFDIRNQKPTLNLEQGVFNDDFQNFAIRIGQKDSDDRTIHDVMMYDHSDATQGRLTQVMAERGEMYVTEDEQFFVMNLYNGHQYMEVQPTLGEDSRSFPFVRTTFGEWQKIFDLSEFQIDRTDEELFKSHQSMLTSRQLKWAIDSINVQIDERQKILAYSLNTNFYFLKKEQAVDPERQPPAEDPPKGVQAPSNPPENSTPPATGTVPSPSTIPELPQPPVDTVVKDTMAKDTVAKDTAPAPTGRAGAKIFTVRELQQGTIGKRDTATSTQQPAAKKPKTQFSVEPLKQLVSSEKDITEFPNFISTFELAEQRRLLDRAKSYARILQGQAESAERSIAKTKEDRLKHVYILHDKFSKALACLIFLFIGAPMGAIVRKGGFGYPILVSIIFFMIFVVITIFSKKLAESGGMSAVLAAWLPCLVLLPIGLFLTRQAMNDSKVLNVDRYAAFFTKLFNRKTAESTQ